VLDKWLIDGGEVDNFIIKRRISELHFDAVAERTVKQTAQNVRSSCKVLPAGRPPASPFLLSVDAAPLAKMCSKLKFTSARYGTVP
jgi:hypothetical protein